MLLTSSACFLGNITSISFKNTNIINDKSFNKVNLKADNEGKKVIDAKLIGADKGRIKVEFKGNECTIIKAYDDFLASGNFNFNNGKFTYEEVEYTITKIENGAFCISDNEFNIWFFKECNLTIPGTIKKIGNFAFYNNHHNLFFSNKEIIGLNFEEGVEEIGEGAFQNCKDLESNKLVLPNSLTCIDNLAFASIEQLKELDLSALDHLIELDAEIFDEYGFLQNTRISTIYVKNKTMKEKYCNNHYWSPFEKYFVVKIINLKHLILTLLVQMKKAHLILIIQNLMKATLLVYLAIL